VPVPVHPVLHHAAQIRSQAARSSRRQTRCVGTTMRASYRSG
jgi:hypothetical protein